VARVELTDASLSIHVEGVDKLLALKSSITIPLEHVAGVDRDASDATGFYHGLRLPGTNVPGVITAGSFLKHGEWTFWDVHDAAHAIVIRLHDERFAKLVIGVDDPDQTVKAIEAALAPA
jgi:hypothetical protein